MVPVPKKFNFGPQMARSRRLALSTLAVVDQSFELENTSKQLIPLGGDAGCDAVSAANVSLVCLAQAARQEACVPWILTTVTLSSAASS